jgi:hypothetical protein
LLSLPFSQKYLYFPRLIHNIAQKETSSFVLSDWNEQSFPSIFAIPLFTSLSVLRFATMTDPATEPTTMISTDDGATTSGDEAGPSKSGDEKAKGAPRARRVRNNNKKGAGRGGGGGPAAGTTNTPAGGGKTDHWRVVKPAFREWLTNITSRDEYNGLGVLERSALLRDFGVAQKGLAPAAVAAATPAKVTAPTVAEPDKPAASAE